MNLEMTKVSSQTIFLLEETLRPAILIGLDGVIVFGNDVFKELTGYRNMSTIQDSIDKESVQLWDEFIKNLHHTTEKNIVVKLYTNDNKLIKKSVKLKYFSDIQQVAALFQSTATNEIPTYKPYSHAFSNSENFMILIDHKGMIFDLNGLHHKFFKLPKEYFKLQHYTVLLRLLDIDKNTLEKEIELLKKTGTSELVVTYQKTLDDLRHYYITTFYDKDTGMYLIRIRDCTDEKVLEQRLAHSDSLSTLGELAASIAHEIRNPMTTLKGFTQLLKLSATEDSSRYISVIEDEIGRMENILDEMLVLSKPASNKKTIFSLEVLVNDMIHVIRPKAVMEGITIVKHENLLETTLISGDADKIKQVLLNLFKNAFEAMSVGGVLAIRIGSDMKGQIVLSVSDSGKGMPINQLNQMFMPFYTSKAGGTGLGLPFVLKTVEEHGGSIIVESELDKGTTFNISFPQFERKAFVDDNKILHSEIRY